MKNSELESMLKRARSPEISNESLEAFPRHVLDRLKRGEEAKRRTRDSWGWAWSFGLAVCVMAVMATIHWSNHRTALSIRASDILADKKVVHEMLTMFPNRVKAITEDGGGLHLILSDDKAVPSSDPLYVHLCDGQMCASFVTFSGEEIRLNGQEVTTLCDPRGGIIVASQQFVWSNTKGLEAGRLSKIEAKDLGAAAL